jgi:hypothetical protein
MGTRCGDSVLVAVQTAVDVVASSSATMTQKSYQAYASMHKKVGATFFVFLLSLRGHGQENTTKPQDAA